VADEAIALTEAKTNWPAVKGGAASDEALAVTVYQPLFEEDASKAIAAEYAGQLLRTGDYGTGDALLNKLPSYLKRSLRHLTKTADPLPAGVVVAP
jgi:putative ATP-dependent endonuclease of OLD family